MRVIVSTLLLLALMSPLTHQSCCSDKCFDQIRMLAPTQNLAKIAAVQLNYLSEKDLCGAVFKANNGTCVDYAELKKFINAAFERMKVTFKTIVDFQAGARIALVGAKPLFEAFIQKNPTGSTPDDAFVTCVGGTEGYKKINSFVLNIQQNLEVWKANLNDTSNNDSKCFELIFQNKIGSICLAASNGADKFYSSADSKFIVKKDFCIPYVNTCSNTLLRISRINALVEVITTISTCMGSTNPRPLDSKFSVDKITLFEQASANPSGIITDMTKLSKFIQEVGFVDFPKSATRGEGKYTNANTIKDEAAAGFKAPLDREVLKNQGIKNDTIKVADMYNSSKAGGPAAILETKKTDLGAIQTAKTSYDTAVETLRTSTVTNTIATARIARRQHATRNRTGHYTQIKTVLTAFEDLIKEDIKNGVNSTVVETKMALQKKIKDFSALLDQATVLDTDLQSVITEITSLETTANGAAYNKTKEDNYKDKLEKVALLDINVKTSFDEIYTAAAARFLEKTLEVQAQVARLTSNIDISQKRSTIAQLQLTAETERVKLKELEKAKLELDAKFSALDGMKTQLATTPVTQDISEATAKYLEVKNKTQDIVNLSIAARNQTNLNSTSTATTSAISALNTLCNSTLTRLNSDINTTTIRLTQGDATATNLQTSFASLDTQKTTLNASITAKQASITQFETLNKNAEAANQVKLSELELKKAEFAAANDKASLQLAELTALAQSNQIVRASYQNNLTLISNDMDRCNRTAVLYCNSTAIAQNQVLCSNNTQRNTSLASLKNQTTQARDTAMVSLDAAYATKKAAVDPLLITRSTKQAELDVINQFLKSNQDSIQQRNALLVTYRDQLRMLQLQLANIGQKKDLQQNTTTTFDSDVRAKMDEQRSIQLQFLNATKNTLTKICTVAAAAVASGTQSGATFKGRLTEVTAGETEAATRLTELTAKNATLATTGAQINSTIESQRASVNAKILELTPNRTSVTTAFNDSQTRVTNYDLEITAQGPPRLLQSDADAQGDVKIDDAKGASSSALNPGVTVNGDLSSSETYSGANDPVPNGANSSSLYGIFSTSVICFISLIAIIAL